MDEALAQATLDLSGRPFFVFEGTMPSDRVGDFDSELAVEFFQALATNARMNLHLDLVRARNTHHAIEALFKATARALRQAVAIDTREHGTPSSKNVLE
jgi:imidazoleglycerol-phosphate dehydratase